MYLIQVANQLSFDPMLNFLLYFFSISRILDDGTISCIPKDTNNTDYQEYLEWVAEGNTAEAAD